MKLLIHAETEQTEQPLVYEGDSAADAMLFVNGITDPITILTVNFQNEINGEARVLSRVAKGDAVFGLIEDGKSWLGENS